MILKNIIKSALIVAGVAVVVSCSEKKAQTKDIIAPKPVAKVPAAPVKMQPFTEMKTLEWQGGKYEIQIKRTVEEDSPVFVDENDNKYYDNRISLKITRADGSDFFNKEFLKTSFPDIIDSQYLDHSTLLSVAFDRVEDGSIYFIGSVGCPDELSDDFIPLQLIVSKDGRLSVKKAEEEIN